MVVSGIDVSKHTLYAHVRAEESASADDEGIDSAFERERSRRGSEVQQRQAGLPQPSEMAPQEGCHEGRHGADRPLPSAGSLFAAR